MKAEPIQIDPLFYPRCQFCVPIYQRQYVWSREKQLEPFWLDIKQKAIGRLNGTPNQNAHYLGAIVLASSDFSVKRVPVRHIIDGQQRLTTIQLFMCAFRDVAKANGLETLANDMGRYLRNQDPHRMEDPDVEIFKLWPTKADRDIFKDIVSFEDVIKVKGKYSHFFNNRGKLMTGGKTPNLFKAYIHFNEWIQEFLIKNDDVEDRFDKQTRLTALWQALLEDFKIVSIQLEAGDDAQVIFNTLNGRGEALLAADLIRNSIFYRIQGTEKKREQTYELHWSPFEDRFWFEDEKQGRYKKPRIEFFMANFLAAKTSNEVKVSTLFNEYQNFIGTKVYPSVEEELQDLAVYRPLYKALVSQETGNPALPIYQLGKLLGPWDISTISPLVLRIAVEASESEQRLMFATLFSFIVRRTVCEYTNKGYNKFFLQILKHLTMTEFSNKSLEDYLLKQTADISTWPTLAEFERAWLSKPLYRILTPMRVRAILEAIEQVKRTRFNEEIQLKGTLTVEHIMPVTWQNHWPLPNGEKPTQEQISAALFADEGGDSIESMIAKRKRLCNTIGNLTLLTQPLNSKVSNGPFEDKKKHIAGQSALALNRDLQSYQTWSEDEIVQRGRELFQLAATVWVRPE